MSRPRLLVAEPSGFSEEARMLLEPVAEVELRSVARGELAVELEQCDALWIRLGHTIDQTAICDRTRCRIIASPVTGLDHIDLDLCTAHGIRVLSLRGELDLLREVRATAELALAIALALLRRIPQAVAAVRRGEWNRDAFRGQEIWGKTVGIVGVGRLGRMVAEYFQAFGASVVGYDPRPDFPSGIRRIAELDELLAISDIVTIHVSYDRRSDVLLGAREFGKMKSGCILVNTSRGGLIDERALLEALQDGRIAGAALDVLTGEPNIGIEHPLVQAASRYNNLLVVPHLGGSTVESIAKTELFLARKLVSALEPR